MSVPWWVPTSTRPPRRRPAAWARCARWCAAAAARGRAAPLAFAIERFEPCLEPRARSLPRAPGASADTPRPSPARARPRAAHPEGGGEAEGAHPEPHRAHGDAGQGACGAQARPLRQQPLSVRLDAIQPRAAPARARGAAPQRRGDFSFRSDTALTRSPPFGGSLNPARPLKPSRAKARARRTLTHTAPPFCGSPALPCTRTARAPAVHCSSTCVFQQICPPPPPLRTHGMGA